MQPILAQLDGHLARTDLARALPQRAYSAPEVFQLEAERVFRNEWLAVCGSHDLPEHGDYLALRIADEPVVVIRGADGALRAFANVCRHRGTLLYTEGRGKAEQVVCPYHGWSYDSAGALQTVPYPGREEIDRASNGLLRFHLEIWRGIVFIHLGAEPDALAERLSGLDGLLDRYAFERFESIRAFDAEVWGTNWKLAFENALDWYHLFRAHSTTLEPISPTRNAFLIEGSPHWSLTASRLLQPAPRRSDDPPGLGDFERDNFVLVSIPPNVVVYATAESWSWLHVLPIAPEQCLIGGGESRSHHLGSIVDDVMASYAAIMQEDKELCERAQSAMRSQRGQGGPLVELDRPISDFHHYLGWKLFDHPLAPAWQAEENASMRIAAAGS